MTTYKVSYEVEAADVESVAKMVMAGFYLADIDGQELRVEAKTDTGEYFAFPATQRVLKHLNETRNAGEGDYLLSEDDVVGED